MVYCSHCDDDCPYVKDPDNGFTCCGMCGKVIDQDMYTEEPTFFKDSSGQSRLRGHIIGIAKGGSLSRERTEEKGRDEIWQIVHGLHVSGGDDIICTAHNFYKLALDNFTRGRRTTHVAASCLYIACRRSEKPYLLIDFSDYLHISVYVLGAVFLQLCQVLLLGEHPIVQKLVDPSLFIHRFAERSSLWGIPSSLDFLSVFVIRKQRFSVPVKDFEFCQAYSLHREGLLGKRDNAVSDTALRIVASMKRDWMQATCPMSQTGRKPSGLCGAALYIAALSHGYMYTKADIAAVVHVCEATLFKRLIEFENTDSGSLTGSCQRPSFSGVFVLLLVEGESH
uniref:Transcription factor IIIB 90 kDa subunit n=1 Tax=Aegilops tauschii TaxID=37682 RepID=M8C9Y8_AEGTA